MHGYLPEEYRPEKTIFVIITDGYENASREYSYDRVKKMIEQKKEDGWEFLFLGANIDAIGEAEKIGIAADRSVTYLADDIGNQVAYEAIADATYEMRCAPDMASVTGSWKTSIEKDVAKRGGKKHGIFGRR